MTLSICFVAETAADSVDFGPDVLFFFFFWVDVFIKTLPEWSHPILSKDVFIMSQYLFCISRSDTVYLTTAALTFSTHETATQQLWLFSVWSPFSFLLLLYFPCFSLHFIPSCFYLLSFFLHFLSVILLFFKSSLLPFCPIPPPYFASSLPLSFNSLPLQSWPPYTLYNTVGPRCIAAAQGIEAVAL